MALPTQYSLNTNLCILKLNFGNDKKDSLDTPVLSICSLGRLPGTGVHHSATVPGHRVKNVSGPTPDSC